MERMLHRLRGSGSLDVTVHFEFWCTHDNSAAPWLIFLFYTSPDLNTSWLFTQLCPNGDDRKHSFFHWSLWTTILRCVHLVQSDGSPSSSGLCLFKFFFFFHYFMCFVVFASSLIFDIVTIPMSLQLSLHNLHVANKHLESRVPELQ